MAERQIVTLPYGEGLDRATGRMVVQPTKFEDLRNVFMFDGKAQSRNGLIERAVLEDDVAGALDVTVMLQALRSTSTALGIGYDSTTREIWANTLTRDGTLPLNVGLFGTLSASASFIPPIIIGADSDNRMFLAHDEPTLVDRIVTQFYDATTTPNLNDLQADLDGEGPADVFFRGVVRHLSYIFGWGYGSASDPNRGDVVRVSLSGDSSMFRDTDFFEAGQQGEPVMVCRPASTFLMVFKETETYQIFGYSPDTFGIRPSDTLFGCIGSRLAVSVAGTVFFWSGQGPRVTVGAESQDLAVPLDLAGPDPATLPAETDPQDAFAEYDAATRVVHFVWGQRVYALSLRDANKPKWSYYELGEQVQCGAQFYQTQSAGAGGAPPTGRPENLTFPNTTPTTIDILFDNFDQTGGEVVEVHCSPDGGATYQLVLQVAANDLATQTVTVLLETVTPNATLKPLSTYKFSLRYRRANQFTTGYTAMDPDVWDTPTFRSQGTETTTAFEPDVVTRSGFNSGIWSRTGPLAEQIIVDWTNPTGHDDMMIEIDRRRTTDGDPGIQNINGMGPPDSGATVTEPTFLLSTEAAGTVQFIDTGITPEERHAYRLRYIRGAEVGPYSPFLSCWAGPDPPTGLQATCQDPAVDMDWINTSTPAGTGRACPTGVPPAQHSTELWWKNVTAGPATWFMDGFVTPYQDGGTVIPIGASPGDVIRVAVRHRTGCDGVFDYSEWFATNECTL